MNPILIKLGPLEIRYYGLMYALAFLFAIHFAKKEAEDFNLKEEFIDNYAITVIISGLLGARLYYVLFNLDYYLSRPLEIPAVWHGGMAIHGAILGGLISTYIYSKIHNQNVWNLTDLAAPYLLFGQSIGRFGNFMNGEVHGVPTFTPWNIIFSNNKFYEWYNSYQNMSLSMQMKFKELVPWGIVFPNSSPAGEEFPGLALHPAMLYELILNFIGFLSLMYLRKKKNLSKGILTFIYIIEYSAIRIFVSFFRAEDLMIWGFRAPHLISIILIGWSLVMIAIIKKRAK
jgi:phosphatidylglycerol:prolipoprotein diacylglycerol transferase